MTGGRLGVGQPRESIQKRQLGAYVKVVVLAVVSGIGYFAFAANWPGEPVTIRLVLAVGLVAINAIGDSVVLRQRHLGEAWSAAHPVDALERKPMPAFEPPTPAHSSVIRAEDTASGSDYIANATAQSSPTGSISGLVADMRGEDGPPAEEDYAWARQALEVE